eukprot:m.550919 g.550919  ORF g.550919 m.550919 type:complete len:753 (+) comp22164_c0_seq3:118-2376(+)
MVGCNGRKPYSAAGLMQKIAFACLLSCILPRYTVSMEQLKDNDPVEFTLTSGTSDSVSFSYVNKLSTRFVLLSAATDRGMLKLDVTNPRNPSWLLNSTVGRSPGLVIEYGIDGSTLIWGQCRAMKYQPEKKSDNITITLSMFEYYDLDSVSYSLDIVFTATPYTSTAPVPGGCCLTCPNANADATQLLRSSDTYSTSLTFYQAGLSALSPYFSSDSNPPLCPCDLVVPEPVTNPPKSTIEYTLYSNFVAACGSPFKSIIDQAAVKIAVKRMVSLDNVLKYGKMIPNTDLTPDKSRVYSIDTVAGQGAVYSVVVTDTAAYNAAKATDASVDKSQFMSVFAPFPTFHCSRQTTTNCSIIPSMHDCMMYPECDWDDTGNVCGSNVNFPDCNNLTDMHAMVLEMITGLCGLFLAIFGHRYFSGELFVLGFLFFTGVGYIAMFDRGFDEERLFIYSGLIGLVGGLVVYFYWFYTRGTAVVCIFIGTCLGVILSCFAFATKLGEMKLWQNKFNFAMAFSCVALLVPIIALLKDRMVNLLTTAVVGCYCFLLAVDFFVASSFDDMLLNLFKRCTLPRFAQDYTGNIFGTEFNGCTNVHLNVLMLSVWAALSILSAMFQAWWTPKVGVPASDRLDSEWCPMLCSRWCMSKQRRMQHNMKAVSRARRDRWSRNRLDNARPLEEVSGGRGFRASSFNAPWRRAQPLRTGRDERRPLLPAPRMSPPIALAAPPYSNSDRHDDPLLQVATPRSANIQRAPVYED